MCGPLMPVSTIALNGVTGHFSRRDLLFVLYIMVYVHPSVNDQTVDLNLTEKNPSGVTWTTESREPCCVFMVIYHCTAYNYVLS